MNETILIKEVIDLSLFFSLFNYAVIFIYGPKFGFESFLFIAVIMFLVHILEVRKKKWAKLLLLLTVLLFVQVRNITGLIYYGGIFLYTAYTFIRGQHNTNYAAECDLFKKRISVALMLLFISMIASKTSAVEETIVPYCILFLVSSVVLLRMLRYLEFNNNSKKINELNIKFAVSITLLSFLAGIKEFRDIVLQLLGVLYDFILSILSILIGALSVIVGFLLKFMVGIHRQEVLTPAPAATGEPLKMVGSETVEKVAEQVRQHKGSDVLLKVVIAFVILYTLVKIIRSKTESASLHEGFKESKERLDRKNSRSGSLSKKISMLFRPKSFTEYIRFYYKRFLQMSIKRGAGINNMDTTLEINEKTEELYKRDILDRMRNIYIKIRYGGGDGDKNTTKEFRKYYDEIKNSKQE